MSRSNDKGKAKTLNYSPFEIPPCVKWAINIEIPRTHVPQILEQLHSIMSERQGASFYYPNVKERTTRCRYEWNRRWQKQRFGLRLGLVLKISDEDVTEVFAYAAQVQAVEDPRLGAPELSRSLQNSLSKELLNTLVDAIERLQPERQIPRHVVFHIEMPPFLGVGETVRTPDGQITVFPTIVAQDEKRISAVCISFDLASNEIAKAKGLGQTELLCALLSLASEQVYRLARLKWPKRRPKKVFLDSLDDVDISRLYPETKKPRAPERFDARVGTRLNFICESFRSLPEAHHDTFLESLFAYYSAEESWHKQPTLASVAYMASLGNLASPFVKKCSGTLNCSQCGALPGSAHNLKGDLAAIASLCCSLFKVEESSDQGRELKALVRRVYSKQRSAFVHDAAFRHREHEQDSDLPSAMPTADEPVSDLYMYENDLLSVRFVTRRILLEWLSKQSKVALDYDLLNLDRQRIILRSSMASRITLPKGIVVGMQTTKRGAREGK